MGVVIYQSLLFWFSSKNRFHLLIGHHSYSSGPLPGWQPACFSRRLGLAALSTAVEKSGSLLSGHPRAFPLPSSFCFLSCP